MAKRKPEPSERIEDFIRVLRDMVYDPRADGEDSRAICDAIRALERAAEQVQKWVPAQAHP